MKRIAALIASLLLLTGCAQSSTDLSKEEGQAVKFYFVADTPRGLKLFSEEHLYSSFDDMNLQVVADLVSGKVAPLDPDYTNLWGDTNSIKSVNIANSVATVDFGQLSLNVGAEAEPRAIDQIIWTLTEFAPAVESVAFTVNGKVVETFAGHVDTTVKFTQAVDYEVLNPIQISSLNEGAKLSSTFTVSGQACTFEANVVWKLLREDIVVQEGFATATTGCPDRGEWSISFKNLDLGDYKIQAIEYSAEDGSLFAKDDKTFTVK
jgi:Immunoglobulin-like domain of bacterial spore germination/Sporulation and spore germination